MVVLGAPGRVDKEVSVITMSNVDIQGSKCNLSIKVTTD